MKFGVEVFVQAAKIHPLCSGSTIRSTGDADIVDVDLR
jgi:hypothetical protein